MTPYFKQIIPVVFACAIVLTTAISHARPVAVTLYPNDAKITEQTAVDLTANGDAYSARFFLPIHAVKDTLTVNADPSEKLWITSVTVEPETLPVEDKIKELKTTLKDLNRKRTEYENRIKANTACIAFWQNQADNKPEKIENVESVAKLGAAIKKGVTETSDEMIGFTVSLEDINEKIITVQDELNKLTGSAQKRWAATVYLTGKTARPSGQPVNLNISYHIRNCGWQPAYTLNAHPEKSLVDLTWVANITQDTGMDWQGVDLKIATAQTVTQPEPPGVRDWVIQPVAPVVLRESRKMKAMPAAAPQSAADGAFMAGAPPAPERETGYIFDTYNLGKRTIPAGETRHITIRELSLKADFNYMVRPQETPQAFLFAMLAVQDDEFMQLPQGEATYLIDSAFVGSRNFSMTDKAQKLFFGPDPQVDVKLDMTLKKSGEKGLLSDKKSWEWGWNVTVHNVKPHPITVIMEDAYPQVRDERIKLTETFTGVTPKKEDNLLKWTFSVAAKTKVAVDYGFTIIYPDDMDVYPGGR
jgi:uncharacterized protein (TIGR02231 family)